MLSRKLKEIEKQLPVDTYWTLIQHVKMSTLYFHAGALRLKMARIDSRHVEVPLKLLRDLQVPVVRMNEETADRVYVLMKALPSTSPQKMWLLKELIRSMDSVDIHYWAWKFGNENQSVVASAMRKLFKV